MFIKAGRIGTPGRYIKLEGEWAGSTMNKGIDIGFAKLTKKNIKAGDFLILKPAVKIAPDRCLAFITVNPELHKKGLVSHPTILYMGDGDGLFASFLAQKDFSIDELSYFMRIYITE